MWTSIDETWNGVAEPPILGVGSSQIGIQLGIMVFLTEKSNEHASAKWHKWTGEMKHE